MRQRAQKLDHFQKAPSQHSIRSKRMANEVLRTDSQETPFTSDADSLDPRIERWLLESQHSGQSDLFSSRASKF
jgi:hypothetical protein